MKELTSKDYITIGLFTVANLVVIIALSMAVTPFLLWAYPYSTGFVLFFSCPVYLLLAYRVGKPGALFLFSTFTGVVYILFGTPYVLIFLILGGLLGELILKVRKKGYRDIVSQTIAFTVMNLIYGFSPYAIIVISVEYYFESMQITGTLRDAYLKFMTTPIWIGVAFGSLTIGIVLGCIFGYHLLKKHFVKAGYVTLES
jgi:energy-coupling factor transport system substrate-specific component